MKSDNQLDPQTSSMVLFIVLISVLFYLFSENIGASLFFMSLSVLFSLWVIIKRQTSRNKKQKIHLSKSVIVYVTAMLSATAVYGWYIYYSKQVSYGYAYFSDAEFYAAVSGVLLYIVGLSFLANELFGKIADSKPTITKSRKLERTNKIIGISGGF